MNIFDRYAPFVQDFIYRNNWEALRAIQVAAGDAVFNTDDNVLLSASTASGKTEAAFFPILTLFSEDMPKSVGAIYIGPLKALINDQFARLNDLCAEADIPVWHWHGDVAQSHKNRLLKNPSAFCRSRRSRWRRCCCASMRRFRSCSMTCASLSSTRSTPSSVATVEGRPSV